MLCVMASSPKGQALLPPPKKGSGYCTKLAVGESKMEILGGLVKLTDDEHLPAPWFNRPSLGLVSNTAVSLGVLKSRGNSDAPPDIIVTPLQTGIMHQTVSVIVDFEERPGVVYDVLSKISLKFNIALAETVTIDQRTMHRITLVLEYPDFHQDRSASEINLQHKNALSQLRVEIGKIPGFNFYLEKPVIEQNTIFEKIYSSTVDQGLIKCRVIRRHLTENYLTEFGNDFDFDAVVVSSSADGRFIRYVTPKKGTFEVTISHKDKPGSLNQVSSALRSLNYNILLSRLSRSVGTVPSPGTSTYVAVCEPPKSETSTAPINARRIREQITRILDVKDPAFELSVKSVSTGTTPERVAFPYRTALVPHILEIRAPNDFRHLIGEYKLGKKKVFLSYQDPANASGYDRIINQILYDEITLAGMEVYDGFTQPQSATMASDVHARMWISSAAFFVVRHAKLGQSTKSNSKGLSNPQIYELGFIHGEGKPWYCICQAGDEKSVSSFMNPERSLITYNKLDNDDEKEEFRMKIRRAIGNWRLNPSLPRFP